MKSKYIPTVILTLWLIVLSVLMVLDIGTMSKSELYTPAKVMNMIGTLCIVLVMSWACGLVAGKGHDDDN